MKLNKLCAALLLCLVASLSYAQEYYNRFTPAADITLEQAIRLGLENNIQLLTSEQSILIAQQRSKEAAFMRWPQFDILATATAYDLEYATVLPEAMGLRVLAPQDGDSDAFYGASLSAVQYLYSGGRISGAIKLSKAKLKEEQSRYEAEKNRVVLDVKTAFYDYLYSDKKATLTTANYEKAKKYAAALNGKTWDSISASAALERFRIEDNNARHLLHQSKLRFLKVLNKELNADVKIKGEFKPYFYEGDLSKLTLWAMQFRPELKTALYEVEMNNISASMSITQNYPDVIVGASYEQVGDKSLDDTNKQISLAVRLPLAYNFWLQPKQKKAQQKQSYLKRTDIEDTIRTDVASNFDSFNFWQTEVVARENSLEVMSKAIKSMESSSGKQYGLPALQALEDYQKTYISYLESVRENLTSRSKLEWAIGQDI
ncbi:outer membrane protein TolC [Elusimicrobium posterum]|uniref:TolC family protein n=1 Tax=Elusimicrobium posterum TaxID=3116653 RepID=UPI003C76AFF7